MDPRPKRARSPRDNKKTGFTCEACRKRKVKCNSVAPSCNRCTAREEQCVYVQLPTISYTKYLQQRIAELENIIAQRSSPSLQNESLGSLAATPEGRQPPSNNCSRQDDVSGDLLERFEGFSVREDGSVTFHGPGSVFHLPDEILTDPTPKSISAAAPNDKQILIENAWRERTNELFTNVQEPYRSLLSLHWCWVQPMFSFVYRPAFTRDMMTNGHYYSTALMNALISHSTRWCQHIPTANISLKEIGGGRSHFDSAVLATFEDVRHGNSTITTVQTLLLLSAQECARGNRSQTWLYVGMAIRLLQDMGLHVDGRRYARFAQLNNEDIEIRIRLFWSTFLWEKVICLYLGRMPILRKSPVSPPHIHLDDTAEYELWTPYGIDPQLASKYPAMHAHSTTCFVQTCQLGETLDHILVSLYDPSHQVPGADSQPWTETAALQLQAWWKQLPDYLKVSPLDLPDFCPPSHIVVLNCLFHTINILLHRHILHSMRRAVRAQDEVREPHAVQCMLSANSILAIYDLFRRTFGLTFGVLSLGFGVYTAASIFLSEIQASRDATSAAFERLVYCIQRLECMKSSSPVLEDGLRQIYGALEKLELMPATVSSIDPRSLSSKTHGAARLQDQLDSTLANAPVLHSGAGNQISNDACWSGPGSLPQVSDGSFSYHDVKVSQEMLIGLSDFEPINFHAAIDSGISGSEGIAIPYHWHTESDSDL